MRLAIIIPRFDREISGGAERLARGFAIEALNRGWAIEVWTSCASSHYDWQNDLPSGQDSVAGVPVRRFAISAFEKERHQALEGKIMAMGALQSEEQYAWLESGPHSGDLYQHIYRHAASYDLLITLPYANPLVHYAAWQAPEKVLFWPCLHDEPYAYLEPVRLLMESAWALAFNSPEEAQIATSRLQLHLQRSAVLGAGVSLPDGNSSQPPMAIVKDTGDTYLVYAGRLEAGKKLAQLYQFILRYNQEHQLDTPLRLVVVGQGPLTPGPFPEIEYRGFVSDYELANLMAGALALCQPSQNESFSLTIMESWLAGRPVLVSAGSAVTRGHVSRSKGGLWFGSYTEFAGAVSWLMENQELASRMGRNGRNYVQANYSWPAVVDRFRDAYAGWQQESGLGIE